MEKNGEKPSEAMCGEVTVCFLKWARWCGPAEAIRGRLSPRHRGRLTR